MPDPYFLKFRSPILGIPLPRKFTFPFAYEPHPLTELAAQELQKKLELVYNESEISGKMYGVLVVLNKYKDLGYLVAFSGQLQDHRKKINFVPPLHDRLDDDGFFKKGEEYLISINQKIEDLCNDGQYLKTKEVLQNEITQSEKELKAQQSIKHLAKIGRKEKREKANHELNPADYATLEATLKKESIEQHYIYRKLFEAWKLRLAALQLEVNQYEIEIEELKTKRKQISGELQQRLFDQYQFLNAHQEKKSLSEIFNGKVKPPAGAGDCSAPKLLQYAYKNDYQPIAMAEFWWGKTPKSELRKEGRFYPACSKKCKPILGHMLEGLEVEDDPMLNYTPEDKTIEIIFEDEALVIINKPPGLLTTPSRAIKDSVFARMQQLYPNATGPLVAHRLDKLTSGLMIITKSKEIYTNIQSQFINRTIKKQYIAILEGYLKIEEGTIDLPLAIDEDNRPMQKVCFQSGRSAQTLWKILDRKNKQTLVRFTPFSGRTHQLRVHAAHSEGLNAPIVGDKLYGNKAERLMLHASSIEFTHPITHKTLSFQSEAQFNWA
jgi:tRNA pseudouridine32 synthase/23S rRNA pseudouridine746 synthase